MYHLSQSAAGTALSRYHLEAGIAACHVAAPDFASVDWRQILALYDRLLEFDNSPVVQLNRAVAVANVHGVEAGLQTLEQMSKRNHIESYYLLHSIHGDFEMRRGEFASAATCFEKAKDLAELESEREFLAGRIRECLERSRPNPGPQERGTGSQAA